MSRLAGLRGGWLPTSVGPLPAETGTDPVLTRPEAWDEAVPVRRRHAQGRAPVAPGGARARLPITLVVAALIVGVVVVARGWPAPEPDPLIIGAQGPVAVASGGASAVAQGAVEDAEHPADPPHRTVAPDPDPDPESGSGPATSATTPVSITVHVVGAVSAPGVVQLPSTARVADAVAAAGGLSQDADLTRVNLARPVVDGEQVLVPRPGEVLPGAAGSGAPAPGAQAGMPGTAAVSGPVDLNAATVTELDALPGIGPVLAGRIVQWRTDSGPFASVEDLTSVSGIGDAVMSGLEGLVTV